MSDKKLNWEIKYEEYKQNKSAIVKSYLNDKVKKKEATKEEYEEYKNYENRKRIKENIPMVTNVLELRNKIDEEIKIIKDEIKRIETLKKANDEEKKIDEELNKILSEIDKIKVDLNKKDLSDEDREKLNSKYQELCDKKNKNNDKYQEIQKTFKDNKEAGNNELNKMSIDDLNRRLFELSARRSKCNMVCNNLMKGMSWDSVKVILDNWKNKTYTSKESIVNKVTPIKAEPEKEVENEVLDDENEIFEDEKLGNVANVLDRIFARAEEDLDFEEEEEEIDLGEDEEEKSLAEVSDFDLRHPRLARIKNWFKNKFANLKESLVYDEAEMDRRDEEEAKRAEEVRKALEEEEQKNKEQEFKQYLKDVAEKGMDGIKKEKMDAARERMEQSRKAAYERESEKFGEDYAKKSYEPKDEER